MDNADSTLCMLKNEANWSHLLKIKYITFFRTGSWTKATEQNHPQEVDITQWSTNLRLLSNMSICWKSKCLLLNILIVSPNTNIPLHSITRCNLTCILPVHYTLHTTSGCHKVQVEELHHLWSSAECSILELFVEYVQYSLHVDEHIPPVSAGSSSEALLGLLIELHAVLLSALHDP